MTLTSVSFHLARKTKVIPSDHIIENQCRYYKINFVDSIDFIIGQDKTGDALSETKRNLETIALPNRFTTIQISVNNRSNNHFIHEMWESQSGQNWKIIQPSCKISSVEAGNSCNQVVAT